MGKKAKNARKSEKEEIIKNIGACKLRIEQAETNIEAKLKEIESLKVDLRKISSFDNGMNLDLSRVNREIEKLTNYIGEQETVVKNSDLVSGGKDIIVFLDDQIADAIDDIRTNMSSEGSDEEYSKAFDNLTLFRKMRTEEINNIINLSKVGDNNAILQSANNRLQSLEREKKNIIDSIDNGTNKTIETKRYELDLATAEVNRLIDLRKEEVSMYNKYVEDLNTLENNTFFKKINPNEAIRVGAYVVVTGAILAYEAKNVLISKGAWNIAQKFIK